FWPAEFLKAQVVVPHPLGKALLHPTRSTKTSAGASAETPKPVCTGTKQSPRQKSGCCAIISVLRNILQIGTVDLLERRIAQRLAALRAERAWTLEQLAARTGMSRATLSRLERGELSPTASMLNTLCAQYGWTASRLMAEAETGPPTIVPAAEQIIWK